MDAAAQCFIGHGFHAATIANIAETAQVSAGLIYRYFENKNAIVLAIIDRQLRQARRNIADLQSGVDAATLVPRLASLWCKDQPDDMDPVLFLEMSAESSRNPEIAEALRRADRISADDFAAWLETVAKAQGARPSPLELRVRGIAMHALISGLAVRVVRHPDGDSEELRLAVEQVIPNLLRFHPPG
nr:TetR/AcrR family transcriptional regulator [Lysobacter sp. GX 14042]